MRVRKIPTDPFRDSFEERSLPNRQQKLSRVAASAAASHREEPKTTHTSPREQGQSLPKRRAVSSKIAAPQTIQPGSVRSIQTLGSFVQKNLIYILSVVIVVGVVALGIVIFAPVLSGEISDEMAEERYVSPYDWSRLSKSDGKLSYMVNGKEKSRLGIDVSENQHTIDWNAVAADDIDFAMIRLGYRGATAGDLYLDERYEENMEGARAVGIKRGVYFFSQATTPEEAREEADFVLRYLKGEKLDYPIAFDSEEKVIGISRARTQGLSVAEMTAIAEAFCDRIEQAGYNTIVYGNRNDISRYKRSSMEKRGVWWAEYGMPAPTGKIDFTMWQYTNTGKVDGIEGDVDMNIDLTNVLN